MDTLHVGGLCSMSLDSGIKSVQESRLCVEAQFWNYSLKETWAQSRASRMNGQSERAVACQSIASPMSSQWRLGLYTNKKYYISTIFPFDCDSIMWRKFCSKEILWQLSAIWWKFNSNEIMWQRKKVLIVKRIILFCHSLPDILSIYH